MKDVFDSLMNILINYIHPAGMLGKLPPQQIQLLAWDMAAGGSRRHHALTYLKSLRKPSHGN